MKNAKKLSETFNEHKNAIKNTSSIYAILRNTL